MNAFLITVLNKIGSTNKLFKCNCCCVQKKNRNLYASVLNWINNNWHFDNSAQDNPRQFEFLKISRRLIYLNFIILDSR